MPPPVHDDADPSRAKTAPSGMDERQGVTTAAEPIHRYSSNQSSTSQVADANAASSVEAGSSGVESRETRIAKRLAWLKEHFVKGGDVDPPPIRSEEDLEETEVALVLLKSTGEPCGIPPGYPETEDGYAEHHRELVDAMKNLVDIDDSKAVPGDAATGISPSGKDGIGVKSITSKNAFDFHLLAARLMRAIRKAQLGRLSFRGREVEKFDNFTRRFRAVVYALKANKLLVNDALDSDEWINRIAFSPERELLRKRNNKTSHETRKQDPKLKDLAKGTKAMKTSTSASTPSPATQTPTQSSKQGPSSSSGKLQMESDTSPTEPPSKRAKVSKDKVKVEKIDGDNDDLYGSGD